MLKIGITSSVYYDPNLPFHTDIKAIKEAGFYGVDYSDFTDPNSFLYSLEEKEFVQYLSNVKKAYDECDLKIYQLHATWDMRVMPDPISDLVPKIIKCFKGAQILNCPIVVIHTVSPSGWGEIPNKEILMSLNIQFFSSLIKEAERYNVTIAIENLPFGQTPEFFSVQGTLELIHNLASKHVKLCMDTGHQNIHCFKRDIYQNLIESKDDLVAFHIHDNNSWTDAHEFPFQGNIDWFAFAKGVKEIGFKGVLSLETAPNGRLPKDIWYKYQAALIDTIKYIASLTD